MASVSSGASRSRWAMGPRPSATAFCSTRSRMALIVSAARPRSRRCSRRRVRLLVRAPAQDAVGDIRQRQLLSGRRWPPVVQHFIATTAGAGRYVRHRVFVAASMLPLALLLRRPPPPQRVAAVPRCRPRVRRASSLVAVRAADAAGIAASCWSRCRCRRYIWLRIAAIGYGAARGAQMLSLMLGCGVVSRLAFGFICDRIGGCGRCCWARYCKEYAAVLFFRSRDWSRFTSFPALFGLLQGGIIPSFAIIVREYFPESEAGAARRHRHHCVAFGDGARRMDVRRDIRPRPDRTRRRSSTASCGTSSPSPLRHGSCAVPHCGPHWPDVADSGIAKRSSSLS